MSLGSCRSTTELRPQTPVARELVTQPPWALRRYLVVNLGLCPPARGTTMGNLSVRPSARSVKNARRCRVCLRTAGAGLEYAFLGNWSAKFEGAFYGLGTITASGVASPHIDN